MSPHEPIALTREALDRLKPLAMRAHDGQVHVKAVEIDGLTWLEVNVLLTDMGDVPPLHTFHMTPTGVLRKPWDLHAA